MRLNRSFLKFRQATHCLAVSAALLFTPTAVASPVQQGASGHPATPIPTFQVATIKPANPREGWGTYYRGNHFIAENTTVDQLLSYAYAVHASQIASAPSWFSQTRFDIDGLPELEGRATADQYRLMVQKLLAERFHLLLHHEQRTLPVYAITLAKRGPTLTRSTLPPDGPGGWGYGPPGVLTIKNSTMESVARVLQRTVLDRPVVDKTGLSGRFDFVLKWTPEEEQDQRSNVAPTTEPAEAPGLYAAMQEQLGLKLESAKLPVDVLVIDHAEPPTPN